MMEKSTQTFTMVKYQKKFLYVYVNHIILIDSVYRIGKNFYPQLILEECKYVVKEKKMSKYIADNIEISSDDSNEEN